MKLMLRRTLIWYVSIAVASGATGCANRRQPAAAEAPLHPADSAAIVGAARAAYPIDTLPVIVTLFLRTEADAIVGIEPDNDAVLESTGKLLLDAGLIYCISYQLEILLYDKCDPEGQHL